MNWQEHVVKWQGCTRCGLCTGRQHVVLARGKLPADLVFVAEAPGESEDVLAEPLVGPAGKLLDDMVREAGLEPFRRLYTNLVACYPKAAKQTGVGGDHRPPADAIKACLPRLAELLALAKPRHVVLVGDTAQTWARSAAAARAGVRLPATTDVVHPARILRAVTVQKSLMIKRTVVTLARIAEVLK